MQCLLSASPWEIAQFPEIVWKWWSLMVLCFLQRSSRWYWEYCLDQMLWTDLRGVELTEIGVTHPVNCCRSKQNEWLCIQEPEGMPNCCPDTLLQWPCASSAGVGICGVGLSSATAAHLCWLVSVVLALSVEHAPNTVANFNDSTYQFKKKRFFKNILPTENPNGWSPGNTDMA